MNLKFYIAAIMPLMLFSCNEANETKKDKMTEYLQPAHKHEENETGLSLNNGEKWQTDESTKGHVVKLDSILAGFRNTGKDDVENYKILADELQAELNVLVADCKMKGPDHEALHQWLMPFMKDVAELKKVSSQVHGKHGIEQITSKLGEFNKYFI